jgi:hypothetical protein
MRVLIYLRKLSKEQSGGQFRELEYRRNSLTPIENS